LSFCSAAISSLETPSTRTGIAEPMSMMKDAGTTVNHPTAIACRFFTASALEDTGP
jgi:hypothetical protein